MCAEGGQVTPSDFLPPMQGAFARDGRSHGFSASGVSSEQRCPSRALVHGSAAQSPREEPGADSALTLPPVRAPHTCLT